MESGSIPDSDVTASSALNSDSYASNARLNNKAAWVADWPRRDEHPWLQVKLQRRRKIAVIATQGFKGSRVSGFVRWYYVSYGDNGSYWRNYTVQRKLKVTHSFT